MGPPRRLQQPESSPPKEKKWVLVTEHLPKDGAHRNSQRRSKGKGCSIILIASSPQSPSSYSPFGLGRWVANDGAYPSVIGRIFWLGKTEGPPPPELQRVPCSAMS